MNAMGIVGASDLSKSMRRRKVFSLLQRILASYLDSFCLRLNPVSFCSIRNQR